MNYLFNEFSRVAELTGQHLQISGIALLVSLLIGVPLGVLAARVKPLRGVLLAVFGVIYTIPSLSLLVLLIPITGLSATTAIITLIAYAQLVLVRNTVVGLTEIDPSIIEAARGMGMSDWQRLVRVELPLALPLIIAGARLAAVSIIAIATVAAFISAGGLGVLLFEGVRTSNPDKIIAGAIAVTFLAAAANIALRLVERAAARGA